MKNRRAGYQISDEGGIEYKPFVAMDRKIEEVARFLDELETMCHYKPAGRDAARLRSYRGLDYRECPGDEGCVDE